MPEFQTRRPSGRPSWPMILLAGIEGSGKSWAAAEATGLDWFGRCLFLEVGEQMADEYGAVPGAGFEIIEHDGTERQVIQAVQWAAEQPQIDGRPNLLVIDSMTEVWTLMQDEQQSIANKRAAAKGRRAVDATITMDQWNTAKDRFNDVVSACRRFPGPVILTARLDNVAVVEGGTPTGEKIWKVRSEKNLVYGVQVIMQAREARKWALTKIASSVLNLPPEGSIPWPDFTVEELLVRMGFDGAQPVPESTYVRPRANDEQVIDDPGARASQQAADEQPMSPAETGESLPDDLPEVVAQLERDGDRDGLMRLYRIAEAAAKRGVPRARVQMARIEGAGKRVKQREQSAPPQDPPVTDSHPEMGEPPVNGPHSDSQPQSGNTHPPTLDAADRPSPSEPATPGGATSDVQEDPHTPTPPSDDRVHTDSSGPSTDVADSREPARNADSDVPIDPPDSRKNTRLRTATVKNLQLEHGDGWQEWVFEQIGLDVDQASTARLQALLKPVEATS